MLSVQEFRISFPHFSEELFPTARIMFYLKLAEKQLSRERWNDWWIDGCYLHAAHYLTLEQEANKTADGTGGIQAAAGAVVSSSKSVGGVSITTSRAGAIATGDPGAGQWNDTIYGKQYWQMAQLIGAGGLQL